MSQLAATLLRARSRQRRARVRSQRLSASGTILLCACDSVGSLPTSWGYPTSMLQRGVSFCLQNYAFIKHVLIESSKQSLDGTKNHLRRGREPGFLKAPVPPDRRCRPTAPGSARKAPVEFSRGGRKNAGLFIFSIICTPFPHHALVHRRSSGCRSQVPALASV